MVIVCQRTIVSTLPLVPSAAATLPHKAEPRANHRALAGSMCMSEASLWFGCAYREVAHVDRCYACREVERSEDERRRAESQKIISRYYGAERVRKE